MTVVQSPLSWIVLAVALALATALAWGQEPQRERRGGERPQSGASSQDQAAARSRSRAALSASVRRVERSNRGSRVLSAERMQSDGRDVTRIKTMDDRGRVRIHVDDPQRRRPEPPRRPTTRDDHD